MLKRYTREGEYSYSLGIAPTTALLQYQLKQVQELVLSPKAAESPKVGELLQICRQHNIPANFDDKQLARLTNQENTYVAGVFNKYAEALDATKNFVVLAQPSDSGNLGTIMRTMAAFGFHDLAIIEPAVDAWDPKVIRASMGAIFQINFHMFPTIEDFTAKVPNPMFMLSGNGEQNLAELKLTTPYSLVFGSEGAGLSEAYLKLGQTVNIPQTQDVDSLNLAIAVGITLYSARNK